ncbi:class I tRNA ligase family protein [Streptomyces sp. MMG1121]|uniref:class I tRNA ligase family protein n=1 Tax=Streptomyces sp. MMG1121 TaxID=1415544 RepID=UPI0006AF4CEE|nr:class I tRNA ligase family protein [Streptomyces sp. MMG1121]KOV61498.1 tRNA synthetase [Streptomyces sp. MMG1121]
MTQTPRHFLVTATPPTTNGDLHVGHLSGPYLGADVFSRAQRMLGHTVLYASGGDDHQTYVVTTAQRLGLDPVELAARCNRDIAGTLELAGIDIDAFTSPDDGYRDEVREFFAGLYRAGRLVTRTWTFPYCAQTGRCLLEAFATGYCPECLAGTCGAICENCGHPNDVGSLLFAASTGAERSVTEPREVEILVLPLEEYREQFTEFYRRRRATMRPHVLRFVEEMLSRPLPDFPVTYPADWGIPVGIDGFDGQVINVWAEMLPGLVHMAESARLSRSPQTPTGVWTRDSGFELVQFLGYDNTFYFSFAHLGLILAHGGLVEPTAIVTNEFYHLDGSKFSTSRRHLIWARDLVGKYGPDTVRFHLALGNPEHQPSNFSEDEFLRSVRTRLHEPLHTLATALAPHAGRQVSARPETEALLERYRDRMRRAYTLETFSLRLAAETSANLLALLAARAADDPGLAVAGLRAFAAQAAPVMPGLAAVIEARYAAAAPGTVPQLADLLPVTV